MSENDEIARLTGWHLGTARPAIMPPLEPCELAGYWYDANGTQTAPAFSDALMGVQAYTVEDARARATGGRAMSEEAVTADANLAEIRRLRAELAQAHERAQRAEAEAEYWRTENQATRDAAARAMEDALALIRPQVVWEAELAQATRALRRAEADNAALLRAAQPLAERFAAQPWEALDADARRLLTVCRAQPYPGADLLTTLALIRGTLRDDPAGAERILAMILEGTKG